MYMQLLGHTVYKIHYGLVLNIMIGKTNFLHKEVLMVLSLLLKMVNNIKEEIYTIFLIHELLDFMLMHYFKLHVEG